MVRENDRWNGALDSLQLMQEAFWYESDVFRLELVKVWRAVTDYISRAALRSVHAQLATFRRKIGVFRIEVNGADKAVPARGGGRGVKISDGLLHAARERRAFPLHDQC
jgi:hypothetical protein